MVARVTVSGAAAKFNARERCCSFGLERLRLSSRDVVVPRENGRRGGGLAPPCQNRAVTTHRERASARAFCIRAVNVNKRATTMPIFGE